MTSFATLLLLAILAAIASGIEGNGDDVITTIDVQYHHLGDHFVPTYQPQTPEGLEYETSFHLSGEVENPAVKMWIRGQVPAPEVTIDYVKLFVNDVLLGNLNEYAMGSGSIYEVDDEVEIEVSIEEGILEEGTNTLKIVTGWGHAMTDRDDIMFWNIRLVRAKPLEMSCNLLSPSPGDAHHPGLDQETVSLIVWNDRHVDALQWVLVTVDPGGANVAFRWTQSTDSMVLEHGATEHASFPLNWHLTSKDILNRTWSISAEMAFRWSFPTDGPVDILVVVRDDHTRVHDFLFEEVLEVRTDLELSGPVTIVGDVQGPLAPGSWVRGGENISVTVPPVTYMGSSDVHPPPGTVTLTLRWDDMETARSVQAPGKDWMANWTVPMLARATVGMTVIAVDLPAGAGAPRPVVVTLEIDGRAPSWLSMWPPMDSWLLDRTVAAWGDVTDKDGAGPDPFSVEFQLYDIGSGSWGDWMSSSILDGQGEGGSTRALTNLYLDEGASHAIRWRARDLVGNGPAVSTPSVFGIDLNPAIVEPEALVGWSVSEKVNVSCVVKDPVGEGGSSGVDPASVELSVLLSGSGGWSDWTPAGALVSMDGSHHYIAYADVDINDGGDNYIRWRARDLAGNPLTVSAPSVLRADTMLPVLLDRWPKGETFEREDDARTVATFSDGAGSGVDADRVEYCLSLGAEDAFTDWLLANASSTSDMVRVEVEVEGVHGHDNWVRWRVWDEAGNGPVEFGPFRLRMNLPPTAVIASPLDGSRHYADEIVRLSSEGSWDPDDEDLLSFEWWSDVDGHLGSGQGVGAALSSGEHTITLKVDDGLGGDHIVEAVVDVRVIERTEVKEPMSIWLLLLLVIVLASVVAVARQMYTRRRRRLGDML